MNEWSFISTPPACLQRVEWENCTFLLLSLEGGVNENDRCVYWEPQIFLYLFTFAIRAWLEPDVYKASIRFSEWTKSCLLFTDFRQTLGPS